MTRKKRKLLVRALMHTCTPTLSGKGPKRSHSNGKTTRSFSIEQYDEPTQSQRSSSPAAGRSWYQGISNDPGLRETDPFVVAQNTQNFGRGTQTPLPSLPPRVDDIETVQQSLPDGDTTIPPLAGRVDPPEFSSPSPHKAVSLSDEELDRQIALLQGKNDNEEEEDPFNERLRQKAAQQRARSAPEPSSSIQPSSRSLSESVFERLGHSLSMATSIDLGTRELVRRRVQEFALNLEDGDRTKMNTMQPVDITRLDESEVSSTLSIITAKKTKGNDETDKSGLTSGPIVAPESEKPSEETFDTTKKTISAESQPAQEVNVCANDIKS